jgi:hypothetical protein
MSTRNLPGGKGRWEPKADNLTAICESTVKKKKGERCLTTVGASTACTGIALPLPIDIAKLGSILEPQKGELEVLLLCNALLGFLNVSWRPEITFLYRPQSYACSL